MRKRSREAEERVMGRKGRVGGAARRLGAPGDLRSIL